MQNKISPNNRYSNSEEYMHAGSKLIGRLIQALQCLPGVGPKSAQRMAYYLLERNRDGAQKITEALREACERVGNCHCCNNLSETELCALCTDAKRDASTLCIVESPSDLVSIEQTGIYKGRYFVLMGHLSPLDGVGPEELKLHVLEGLLEEGYIKEVVLAMNLTVEGEATAHYVSEMIRSRHILVTQLAYGIPVGGELEYLNRTTVAHAFQGRRSVSPA